MAIIIALHLVKLNFGILLIMYQNTKWITLEASHFYFHKKWCSVRSGQVSDSRGILTCLIAGGGGPTPILGFWVAKIRNSGCYSYRTQKKWWLNYNIYCNSTRNNYIHYILEHYFQKISPKIPILPIPQYYTKNYIRIHEIT